MARNNKPNTQPNDEVPEVAGEDWLVSSPAREVMRVRTFNDEALRAIDSWDAAMAAAEEGFGTVPNAATELGNGFRIATEDDKMRLVGVPLLLLEWTFNSGDFGDFVSITAIQRLNNGSIDKWIINDGSTGIRKQLTAYQAETGRTGGLGIPRGLRVSSYYMDAESSQVLTKEEVREYLAAQRKMVPAHTFYLDTSA